MISYRIFITGFNAQNLEVIENRVDNAIVGAVDETGRLGETIGKDFLASHIFTGNAYNSWKFIDTGKYSAMNTYLDAGIPHPTGKRSSAYFEALENGRRGYRGSPNKIASGNSGGYTYPHFNIGPASGTLIVFLTSETLRPQFMSIMSSAVGGAL